MIMVIIKPVTFVFSCPGLALQPGMRHVARITGGAVFRSVTLRPH